MAATATPAIFRSSSIGRDNRLNMIHEGTHGIQALDLLGRKVVMQGGRRSDALLVRKIRSDDFSGARL